ncbi:MAG: hypothetical protein R3300_00330 [Candidatus Promineifilaceae bacterium]|nr:hypothetical protein [Candidatus Promineifilaceae bacterium]
MSKGNEMSDEENTILNKVYEVSFLGAAGDATRQRLRLTDLDMLGFSVFEDGAGNRVLVHRERITDMVENRSGFEIG